MRENRRVGVAPDAARLVLAKTLEGFDFTFQPSLDRDHILALAQLGFVERAEVVHLPGPPGTGKTHIATALGGAAVKAGRGVYMANLAEVVESPAKAGREGRLAKRIRHLTRASLLIVDEIGCLPVSTGDANLFLQLVNARHEGDAMIPASNCGLPEWGEVFGDPVVATALLDRPLHHASVIHIEGASHRRRDHTDLVPKHVRATARITPPAPSKRRGRTRKEEDAADT